MKEEKITNATELEHQSKHAIGFSTFIIRVIATSGYIFFVASLFGLGYMAITISDMKPIGLWGAKSNDELIMIYLDYYMIPISLLLISIIAGLFGYVLIKIAFSSTKKVIPDEDRELLEEIIKSDNAEPLKRYISLSSLSGSVGIFTKIGLTGLPLATIALTLIFALLSFLEIGDKQNFIDFTKLTLGAFLGSYVQRNIGKSPSAIQIDDE